MLVGVPGEEGEPIAGGGPAREAGVVALVSCRPGEVSVEDEGLEHGVFMHYLLKGLEGDADEEGGDNAGDRREVVENAANECDRIDQKARDDEKDRNKQ